MNVEKDPVIEKRLQKLVDEIKKANWEECDLEHMARLAEERINELQQRGVKCVDRCIQKLLDRVDDKDTYLDILMEGRFAIMLARNGFNEIQIEYSEVGPDIKARYNGQTVYFEVTRRRPNEEDERLRKSKDAIWIRTTRAEIIIGKIQEKLKQLKSGETNIVVLWSDTVTLGRPDVEEAFKYIRQEIYNDPRIYKDLSGVLLTGPGVDSETLKQSYLFENDRALGTQLAMKLESLSE